MPTPTIPDGKLFMNATLWTGDGTTSPRNITNGATGQSFQPDLVWTKDRTSAYNHQLFDSVRGVGSSKNLMSNQTDAEGVNASSFGYLSAFNSNGFALTKGTDPGNEYLWVGKTSDNYVAWQWKANGTAVTNTAGNRTSQVSANTTSGFSVVTYTGNGAAGANVGHGLGVAPSMMIVKQRGGTTDWAVYHASLPSAFGVAGTQVLNLNATTANTQNFDVWDSNNPAATFFSVGASTLSNANGGTFVAYCWAPIAGYSAFGSYTGNGSADGPFVYLGFRPRFLLLKVSSTLGSWTIVDTARDPFNLATDGLYPDLSLAEDTSRTIDILSNGFKFRSAANNISGATFIYAAFAENPFKYANAR